MDIPKKLYSYDTKSAFENCIMCNTSLLVEGTQYMIEKSVRRFPDYNTEEIIYEYAICLNCAFEQKKSMSEESMKAVEQYMLSFGNIFKDDNAEGENCAFYNSAIMNMHEYMVQGICIGSELMPGTKPILIGEKAMSEISKLISKKTKDEMDGFIDVHFGGPPEFRELLKRKVVII